MRNKVKTGLCFVVIIFQLTCFAEQKEEVNTPEKFIYTRNGRLYYPDGKEVALWGVNFQPNLSWEYRSRYKPLGYEQDAAILKKAANDGFDEIQKMNCNLIRCHLTPADFTDDQGNLVENLYLDVLDYMVAEASKRGMYVYLAFINHMGKGYVQNSFMNDYVREEWMCNERAVKCSENYISRLLKRKNRYSGLTYKNDPAIAVWEVINEPGYYSYEKAGESAWYQQYQDWLKEKYQTDDKANYARFRKQMVLSYINNMVDHIKKSGASQPVVWNCNWHKMLTGHEDVFEAVSESKVEVVSFCNYPGQNECKQPYYLNPEDFTNHDFSSFFRNAYSKRDWYAWVLEGSFRKKAKVVYEFETFYNQSAYLYPVMADLYRSLGVQMAAMWTYCFPGYAQYHNGSHFLSLTCTPRKSASFVVAGEIFSSTPLYESFDISSPVEKTTRSYAYSYAKNISVFASEDKFYYSGDVTDYNDLKPGENVHDIIGIGNSSLVSYDGSGIYKVKRNDDQITITIEPDAKWISEPWQQGKYKSKVTELTYDANHIFELNLGNGPYENYNLYRVDGEKKVTRPLLDGKMKFSATPGNYIITKN